VGAEAAAPFVERKLRRAWRKERRFHHSQGMCFFVLWALALVLLDLLVDWLFLIPGHGRVILLAINVVTLGVVAHKRWLRQLRRYNPVRTALQVERRHPELQSLLVSFVQLGGTPRDFAYASPSLIRALRRQAIEVTKPLDFREIVSFKELKRILLVSICVILFFAAISVNWPEHLRVLVYRMLNPRARTGYPTRTTIESITGDVTAQQGATVGIEAWYGGVEPSQATLYVKPQEGTWETLALRRAAGKRFTYRFQEVYQSFEYRVRLGDASSEVYEVEIVPPPRVVEARVVLRFPDYTGRTSEATNTLNLEVPEGTEIEWQLRCDRPLSSAEMIRDEEKAKPEPMTLDPDGRLARLTTTATESFAYQFCWTEREHGYVYDEDIRYYIQVIPDVAPQVDIIEPTEDQKATVRKKLAIAFQARDDYRVAAGWVVYSLNEGAEQRHDLGSFRRRLLEKEVVWPLQESIANIKEGDLLTYLIEVADNHAGKEGPYRARSQLRRLYIVSDREYLQYISEKTKKALTEVGSLHKQEEKAAKQVGELQKEDVGKGVQ